MPPNSKAEYHIENDKQPDLAANSFWRILTLLIKLFFQMFTLIVLSRILPVTAFGKLAFVMIFVGLATKAARFGVASAIIQKPHLTHLYLRAGFTLSIVVGFATFLVLYFSAPFLSSDLETIGMIQAISIIFIFIGFASVAEAQLLREFNFKAIFFVELIAFFIGYTLFSIGLALMGYGVWSLAAAIIITAFLRAALMIFIKRGLYLPSWSLDEIRNLAGFGAGLTLSGFMYFASQNLDYFVTGHLLGDESLAYYSRARQLITIPADIINATAFTILLTAFSRLKADKQKLKELYLTSASTIALPTITIAAVLIVIAPELIVLLFGMSWVNTTIPLQILAINGFFALYTVGDALFVSQRKIYWQMASQTTFAVSVGLTALLGAKWGIKGVAIGVMLSTAACYFYVAFMSLRLINGRWSEFFRCQAPALVMGLTLVLIGGLAKSLLLKFNSPGWVVVLVITVLTIITFFSLVLSKLNLFQVHREMLIGFVKTKMPSILGFIPK